MITLCMVMGKGTNSILSFVRSKIIEPHFCLSLMVNFNVIYLNLEKMPLDINRILGQIDTLAAEIKSRRVDFIKKIRLSTNLMDSLGKNPSEIVRKLEQSRTSWLVAGIKEGINQSKKAEYLPTDFCVMGSDGSHIDVDRHRSERLFLLNTAVINLQYGSNPQAEFISNPVLYFGDRNLNIRASDGREVAIEGSLLGVKRSVEECRCLADEVCRSTTNLPVLGLLDGSLIMWGLVGQRYDDFVIDELLQNGMLPQFDRFYDCGKDRRVALASYISFPRSTDVINLLRIAICPFDPVDCDRHCKGKYEDRPCDDVDGLTDRILFNEVLNKNDRSAVFISRSSINDRYGKHRVCFFYLKLDEEVARIEIPQWVADRSDYLDFVHSAILDQCQKGFGYPVCLSEAHELAVITGTDREQFWNLLDRIMQTDQLGLQSSLKQRSKQLRWI